MADLEFLVAGVPGCNCLDCQRQRHVQALGRWREYNPPVAPQTAKRRSLKLLRQLLIPEQLADYKTSGAFNLFGSRGGLYRLTPERTTMHSACINDKAVGYSVWPIGECNQFPADWAVAVMLWLMSNEGHVVEIACREHYGGYLETARIELPTTYHGALKPPRVKKARKEGKTLSYLP